MVHEPFGEIKAGQGVALYCIATGFRLGSVLWWKESDGTQETGDYSLTGIELHTHNLEYYLLLLHTEFLNDTITRNMLYFNAITKAQQDVYRCTARNVGGSNYQLIDVTVHESTVSEPR